MKKNVDYDEVNRELMMLPLGIASRLGAIIPMKPDNDRLNEVVDIRMALGPNENLYPELRKLLEELETETKDERNEKEG